MLLKVLLHYVSLLLHYVSPDHCHIFWTYKPPVFINVECEIHMNKKNKSTQRVQISLIKAAHCPHIALIPGLASQHGDPDHPKNEIN